MSTLGKKLQEFIAVYVGRKNIGTTPGNRGQCVGLVAQWIAFLNLKHIWGHAKDLHRNIDPEHYTFIVNTAKAYPRAGDIVVWDYRMGGGYGHAAIATGQHVTLGKSSDWFEAFSQNDPVGSGCQIKKYSYASVIGWIRPKYEPKNGNIYMGIDLSNAESVKECVKVWRRVVDGEFIDIDKHKALEKKCIELEKKLDLSEKRLAGCQTALKQNVDYLSRLGVSVPKLQKK